VAVLVIAIRYRREFDNVLDGIVYGAVVGFGFAMTGNLIDYVSSFALRGFEGLSLGAFVEGLLYGLNHALYTATFGAGLGSARLAKRQWQRWAWGLSGFVLGVVEHVLHNLMPRHVLGLDVVTVLTTGAGLALIGIVAAKSLARQQRSLRVDLKGQVPQSIYHTMVTPGRRVRAEWQALRVGGPRAWRQRRRLHGLCAELALKRMQHRHRPNEPGIAQDIERLREEIDALATQVV
jgi:hypothetical protein